MKPDYGGNSKVDAYALGYSKNPSKQMTFKPSESRQASIKPITRPQIVEDSIQMDEG